MRFFYDVGGGVHALQAFLLDLDARFARVQDLVAHMQHLHRSMQEPVRDTGGSQCQLELAPA